MTTRQHRKKRETGKERRRETTWKRLLNRLLNSRLMACFRGNREEFYGEVLLLDETKFPLTAEQGIKKSSKAAAILKQVFSRLNVAEVDFFGLRFCDDKQQTNWLDPSKTLSQHRSLLGPPYIFYFGVKFYAEDPTKLEDEPTRHQFYLQLRQDVRRGRLLCPAHLRPRLFALMMQVERGDYGATEMLDPDEDQETLNTYRSLSGVARPQALNLFLSLCSSLQMYGVSLFNAYGENQSEYFLGPTPVGVVIYKNKVLVGKYLWQRITKLHFKNQTFELRVAGKQGSETSFFFHTSDCKRLWRSCVEHHVFFRMSESNPVTHKLRRNSVAHSPTLTFPWLNVSMRRNKSVNNKTTTTELCIRPKQPNSHTSESVSSEPVKTQTAPPAVNRSEGSAKEAHVKPSAPWESGSTARGLFNPRFPPTPKEDKYGKSQRRCRSLDGDQPIREHRRRSRSRGNTSSGSESEKTASNSERHRRRKNRRSPDALLWQHIEKQLVEPSVSLIRQTEEIPFTDVRVSQGPIRARRSPRRRRHHQWASASDLCAKVELVPPLPVTKTTDTSCHLPTNP